MKVVEETHTRLVIKHQPISDWLSGGLLFIFGLSFWIYFIAFDFTSLRLTCTHSAPPEINCELKKFTFFGRMTKLKIFDPQQAYIQTKTGSKGSKSYQVIIVSKFGEFSLLSQVSYQENEVFVSQLNSFINSSESFIILQQNQRNYLFFISLFMLTIIVTGAYSATSSATTCTFYKSINKVFIERKGFRSKKIIEYPLEEIGSFHIQDKQNKYSKVYQAVILFKNDQEIPINPQYTDKKSVDYVVARIRQFLNLKY
ncbi:MAG: hypothetical protein NWQ43_05185 [Dolichospermum sp.]|nr:hypothetical protein [Dolichospermum sp.]